MDLAGKRTIKRFRVAREGQTVDGRGLSRQQITDMADTYDPVEYTARINVEHSGGWGGLESTNYPVLGDVIAVDAQLEKFTINGVTVELMCLYATLSALPVLVEANQQGKKLFTSIEFYPKFADTGRAYLVGLAVTDIPASRGTEPLKFHATTSNSQFTELQELTLMSVTPQVATPVVPQSAAENTVPQTLTVPVTEQKLEPKADDSFLAKFAALFAKKPEGMTSAEQDAILQGFSNLQKDITDAANANAEQYQALEQKFTALQAEFTGLKNQLNTAPAVTTITPPVGAGHTMTEY